MASNSPADINNIIQVLAQKRDGNREALRAGCVSSVVYVQLAMTTVLFKNECH